jgi:hypothetical protein
MTTETNHQEIQMKSSQSQIVNIQNPSFFKITLHKIFRLSIIQKIAKSVETVDEI